MNREHEREFREFVAARSAVLLRTAYLLTGDTGHAQDLLQTALMATARRWVHIRHREQPDAYVRRAIYRQQVNRWRARARRPETLMAQPPDRPAGHDHASELALRHDLVKALRSLPPRQRAIVVLRYYEDRSEAEVAALLDIALGTVRSQASRALAKLRQSYPDLANPAETSPARPNPSPSLANPVTP